MVSIQEIPRRVRHWWSRKSNALSRAIAPPKKVERPFGDGAQRADALSIAPIGAAVSVISEIMATFPLKVYEKKENGRRKGTNHPVGELLKKPSEFMTGYEFMERIVRDMCLWGNFYAFKVRGRGGAVVSLIPLNAYDVEAKQLSDWSLVYQLASGAEVSGKSYYTTEDILHLRYQPTDGVTGIAPVLQCLPAASIYINACRHLQVDHTNMSRPQGIIKMGPQVRNLEMIRETVTAIEERVSQTGYMGIVVFENGVEFQSLSEPGASARCRESMDAATAEISRIFRIPPHEMQLTDRSTSWGSGIEQLSRAFVDRTLGSWARRIEQALGAQLFTPEEQNRYFLKFNMDALLRGDTLTRYQAYQIATMNGYLNANEVRRKEDLPDREGGDDYYHPANLTRDGGTDGTVEKEE